MVFKVPSSLCIVSFSHLLATAIFKTSKSLNNHKGVILMYFTDVFYIIIRCQKIFRACVNPNTLFQAFNHKPIQIEIQKTHAKIPI